MQKDEYLTSKIDKSPQRHKEIFNIFSATKKKGQVHCFIVPSPTQTLEYRGLLSCVASFSFWYGFMQMGCEYITTIQFGDEISGPGSNTEVFEVEPLALPHKLVDIT